MKRRTYELLEVAREGDRMSRIVDLSIFTLIVLNIMAVVLETVQPVYQRWGPSFRAFELFSVAAFSLEYLLRVWSCTENPLYSQPISGRVQFMLSPLALVDLAAVLPFFLALGGDFRILRALRLFRLVRLGKVARYSSVLHTFGRVLNAKKEELITLLSFVLVVLLLASSLVFFAERDAQPERFSSIPAAMWWGVSTLTTVGYGDMYPVTALGKLIASGIEILGIGLFALPAGMLGSAFVEDMQKRKGPRGKSEERTCPHCGRRLDAPAV